MTYEVLLELLLSDDVYNKIKDNEEEVLKLINELILCINFKQNSKWHVYDVYEHILHVVEGTSNNKCLRLASLFHDIGKPLTYAEDDRGGHFFNHWNESIKIFNRYRDKFNLSEAEFNLIVNLIYYHDLNIDKLNSSEREELFLILGLEGLKLLFELKRADLLAQSPEFHYLINNINKQEKELIKR